MRLSDAHKLLPTTLLKEWYRSKRSTTVAKQKCFHGTMYVPHCDVGLLLQEVNMMQCFLTDSQDVAQWFKKEDTVLR